MLPCSSGKKGYLFEDYAKEKCERLNAVPGRNECEVYQCRECHLYHLTKKLNLTKSQKRARQRRRAKEMRKDG